MGTYSVSKRTGNLWRTVARVRARSMLAALEQTIGDQTVRESYAVGTALMATVGSDGTRYLVQEVRFA